MLSFAVGKLQSRCDRGPEVILKPQWVQLKLSVADWLSDLNYAVMTQVIG